MRKWFKRNEIAIQLSVITFVVLMLVLSVGRNNYRENQEALEDPPLSLSINGEKYQCIRKELQ